MSNQRRIDLDIIRIIACLMVITMHAPIPNENASSIFLSSISYFTAPCIGLFFMVSGCLLLPTKTDGIIFLKKRFSKILYPTLFWSFFYILCKYLESVESIGISTILSIPFSAQGDGILWFMYTLAGLYLLAPIISRWLEQTSKKEIEFYLILWGISTCYPIFKQFLTTTEGPTNILYYFTGYAGYFLLGYYINKYPQSFTWKWLMPLFTLSCLAPIYCKITNVEVVFYEVFWYLSIFVVIMSVSWFMLIHKTCIDKTIKLDRLSNLSFGIYLSHIFVMRNLIWKWDWILQLENYILQTMVVIILTFIGSAILSYAIAQLPFGDYIIGYKLNKLK